MQREICILILHLDYVIYVNQSKKNGSGWVIDELIAIDVRVIDYTPVPTGSYLPTPKGLDGPQKGT